MLDLMLYAAVAWVAIGVVTVIVVSRIIAGKWPAS
jgi:hypothetical protein